MAKRTVARLQRHQAITTAIIGGLCAVTGLLTQNWGLALFGGALAAAALGWAAWYEKSRHRRVRPDGTVPGDEELPAVTPQRFALALVFVTVGFATLLFVRGEGLKDLGEVLPPYLTTMVFMSAAYAYRRRKDRLERPPS